MTLKRPHIDPKKTIFDLKIIPFQTRSWPSYDIFRNLSSNKLFAYNFFDILPVYISLLPIYLSYLLCMNLLYSAYYNFSL